jgi:tRNA (cmo5U34)-methyltransferase
LFSFFDERAGRYDGATAAWDGHGFYDRVAACLDCATPSPDILDLGIGTGFELSAIFQRFPKARVTGVDLSSGMLEALSRNFAGKLDSIRLFRESVLDFDFGEGEYDFIVSIATMHHFLPEQRLRVYRKACSALRPGGRYLEADKFVSKPLELHLQRKHRPEIEQAVAAGLPPAHIDIPAAFASARSLLRSAGFESVETAYADGECRSAILLAGCT